jgi:hypothetical protein
MYEAGLAGPPNLEKAVALRLRAQQVDPQPIRTPESAAFFKHVASVNQGHHEAQSSGPRRRYVVYRRIRLIGCGWVWC